MLWVQNILPFKDIFVKNRVSLSENKCDYNRKIMEDKKPPIAWDEADDKKKVTLRELLRPSLITMAVCGCYTYDPWTIRSGQSKPEGCLYRVFGTFYRILFLIVCLIGCVKAFSGIANIPSDLFPLSIAKTIWYSQCLVVSLISLKSSYSRKGSQKVAFDFWDDKISPEMIELEIEIPIKLIRKRQMIHVVVAICLAVLNMVCNILLFTDVISDRFKVFIAAPFAPSVPVLIIEGLILAVVSMLWFLPVSYLMNVSTILSSTFDAYNKYQEENLSPDCTKVIMLCQRLRTLHLNITKVVSLFDQDFGYYFATNFVFSIGLSCFMLYQLLQHPGDTISIVMFAFWVAMPLVLLSLTSISAAIVNDTVGMIDICHLHVQQLFFEIYLLNKMLIFS